MANKYKQFSKAKRGHSGPLDIIRFRKCSMKQTYGSKVEAEQSANKRLFAMRAYRCSFCKQWHLTSK